MVFIGITGGIGSGKSLVCSQFATLNVPIFFADNEAREITENDEKVQSLISKHFGVSISGEESSIGRKKLAEIVFSDYRKLQQLNSIIHPIVFSKLESWKIRMTKTMHLPYGLVEAALIFESGMDKKLDYVLSVISDDTLRISRVVERDGSNERLVRNRMKYQMKPEELSKLSDFIIQNNGSQDDLAYQSNIPSHPILKSQTEA